MKKTLILPAPAKINLGLWVKEKRPDGFHEISSVMQTISLADTITLKEISEEGIHIFCNHPEVPTDSKNLAHQAARIFLEKFGIEPNLAIKIDKKIPIAAGLAGGSSDAGAVISGLARMYEKPVTIPDLMEMGAKIGSDIPFVLHGGLALAEGRGELLKFYEPPRPPMAVVIVVPNGVKVSTRWAYENYVPGNNLTKSEIFPQILTAYRQRDLDSLGKVIFNDLESVTLHRYPEVERIKQLLGRTGEGIVQMSGSGPSVFGLFSEKKSAMRAVRALHGEPVEVFIEHITRKNTQ
jgi:4-diphosphocytidyl-2-C-methyl-D-erythritol kinase